MVSICKQNQSQVHQNGVDCEVTAYPTDNPNMDMAISHIHGRYPSIGFVTNQIVDEMLFIQSGTGTITTRNGDITEFEEDDVITVPKQTEYFFEGDFMAVIACTPAFTIEQHVHMEE